MNTLRAISETLLVIAGLVVAYVRNYVQYGHYSWGSIVEFLSWWFIHYIAVGAVAATSYVVIKRIEKIVGESENSQKGLTWQQAILNTSVIILASAIFIFLLAHWGGGSTHDEW